jgi:acylpyruvate hydrolase
LVVGQRIKSVSPDEALAGIAGCTVATTVTVFDDIPGLEAYRMYDSILPFGPEVVPVDRVSIEELSLHLDVDGTRLDTRTTADWRFTPGEMVAYASEVMTLEPGDLVLSGDPIRTDHVLSAGERVSTVIEDVGRLENEVEADQHE